MRLAERVAALPLAIHVEGEVPFNVTHGDLDLVGSRQDDVFGDESVCVHKAEAMTKSRQNFGEASRPALLGLQFGPRAVQISPTPLGALPFTNVGHSPLQQVTVPNPNVYIDRRDGWGRRPRLTALAAPAAHGGVPGGADTARPRYGTLLPVTGAPS